MRGTVFLFDVDGTLIHGGGSSRAALECAFEAVVGRSDVLAQVCFAGMTDRGIVREGLRIAEVPATERLIDEVLAAYVACLPRFSAAMPPYRMLPGVLEAIALATGQPNAVVGLGTGNVEVAARHKLAPLDLSRPFGFGGFGCDAEERAAVLAIGAKRGASRLGLDLETCRVVVIGDTPRDVAAARAIGAACLGVATGSHDAVTLRRAGAHWVAEDLTASVVAEAFEASLT